MAMPGGNLIGRPRRHGSDNDPAVVREAVARDAVPVQAWKGSPTETERNVFPWAIAIARRVLVDNIRRNRRRPELPLLPPIDEPDRACPPTTPCMRAVWGRGFNRIWRIYPTASGWLSSF